MKNDRRELAGVENAAPRGALAVNYKQPPHAHFNLDEPLGLPIDVLKRLKEKRNAASAEATRADLLVTGRSFADEEFGMVVPDQRWFTS